MFLVYLKFILRLVSFKRISIYFYLFKMVSKDWSMPNEGKNNTAQIQNWVQISYTENSYFGILKLKVISKKIMLKQISAIFSFA